MPGSPQFNRGEYKRRANFKHRYGITLEYFDEMVAKQGGGCAICGTDQRLVVDHCHHTGKVRGVLCGTCNTGIGHLKDDPDQIRLALAYLINS